MRKQKSKFRILRNPFKFKSKKAKPNHDPLNKKSNRDMQTSPSQKSRRLLGSIVLGRRQSLSEKYNAARNLSEDNKENNGSIDQDCQSCTSAPEMDREEHSLTLTMQTDIFPTKVALNSKRDTQKPKELRKIPMTCSDLQNLLNREHNRVNPLTSSITAASNDILSPTSAASSSTSLRGRRRSDTMKYSSLTEKNCVKVPSAKTISDRLFVSSSASSSECASLTGLQLSSSAESCPDVHGKHADMFCSVRRHVNRGGDRGGFRKKGDLASSSPTKYSGDAVFYRRDASLSPETLKIMEEVENAYMSSPIPPSYLSSPPKHSPAMPAICIGRSRNEETSNRYATNSTSRKTKIEASSLLTRAKKSYELKSTHDSSLTLDDAPIEKIKRNGLTADADDHIDRETFSVPSESEWKSPSDRYQRSSARSPLTIVTEVSKPVALAVKREMQQRNQRIRDANTKDVDGRQNLDKRTARLRFGDIFAYNILQHRAKYPHLNNASNHADKIGSVIQHRAMNGISVAIRKRPIFDYELDRGDFDVVSINNTTESSQDICIVHNCVMHPDMKQMLMKPTNFPATAAFDEHCSDDDIYRHLAEPLVNNAANGGISTMLMYGQTGCGKSFTMSGIELRTARGLFRALQGTDRHISDNHTVTMQFVELCGSKECRDLLTSSSVDIKVLDCMDGSVQLANATTLEISTPDDMLVAMNVAKGRRATEATDKNGASSRSHAVCQLRFKGRKSGVLTLIDCAGSERRHDSMYHSSERQRESAEINASLWSLKECIRARANKCARIPYRGSTLTRILRETFERDDAKLCIIGCVAPNATDTEHTIETLKTISGIVGIDVNIVEEKALPVTRSEVQAKTHTVPKQWSHEHLLKFLAQKKMNTVNLSSKHDGAALMKMSIPQMKAQLFDDRNADKAKELFNLLRRENDRMTKLQRRDRICIMKERKGIK